MFYRPSIERVAQSAGESRRLRHDAQTDVAHVKRSRAGSRARIMGMSIRSSSASKRPVPERGELPAAAVGLDVCWDAGRHDSRDMAAPFSTLATRRRSRSSLGRRLTIGTSESGVATRKGVRTAAKRKRWRPRWYFSKRANIACSLPTEVRCGLGAWTEGGPG